MRTVTRLHRVLLVGLVVVAATVFNVADAAPAPSSPGQLPESSDDSAVSGTVTDAVTGGGIAGAWVAALRPSDFSLAGGGIANSIGDYAIALPPGTYFLYLLKPGGDHAPGFYGAPTTVTVPEGGSIDADPTMAPTTGSINGVVSDQSSGNPVNTAWIFALNGTNGQLVRGGSAPQAGQYQLSGLQPGPHFLVFLDRAGAHATEFFDGAPGIDGSTRVSVTPGGFANANASMLSKVPPTGGATLQGTVTEQRTGGGLLPGIVVVASYASTYQVAAATTTNVQGHYTLNLDPGSYKVTFVDPTGRRDVEWYDDVPANDLGSAVSVTVPAVVNAALRPNTGRLTGRVTEDGAGGAVAGTWVVAIGPNGALAGGAVTDAMGNYAIDGLAAGSYRVTFVDPSGVRAQEYWEDSPTYGGATLVGVVAGGSTTVDASVPGSTPANNAFADALVLEGTNGTVSGTSIGATKEAGEPNHAGTSGGASIWYRWTAPFTGNATVSTCGSAFDTALAVYTGSSLASLTPVAGDDDTCGFQSRASLPVTAGTTYRIAVDGFDEGSGAATGAVVLNWMYPPNDHFAWPRDVSGIQGNVQGSTVHASTEAGEPNHDGLPGGASIWYRWIAPTTGVGQFTTCASSFDTTLAVYTGTSLESLVLRATNDDGCGPGVEGGGVQSVVTMQMTAGTTYLIAVDGYQGATGDVWFNWDAPALPGS